MKKLRTIATLLSAILVLGALFAPLAAEAKKKKKKAPSSAVVGEDPAGDWGMNVDPELAPIGDALGMDMTKATVELAKDGKTLNFIIGLNSLPPNGGAPEIARYTWDFLVDGEYTELDGKYTNYTRGACDPTSGQCPPPRDPGLYPFIVRANCGVASDTGTSVTTCEEVGVVEAAFDASSATITIPVPMDIIHAKQGSKIAPGSNIFGGSISALPAAFLSSSAMPYDVLTILKTFTVPR